MARLICALALSLACGCALAVTEGKVLLGWIEPVMLDPKLGLNLYAKLDTGADTSSLDAQNIRRVRVGDKAYVRFTVRHPETGEFVELRKPFIRRVRIKRHGGLYQRRYVVRMQVCVGDRTRAIEINLVDRAEFDYPMLLGRSALEGWSVVDPDNSHTTAPRCWDDPGEQPDDLAPNPPDLAGTDSSEVVSPTSRAVTLATTLSMSPALAAAIPQPAPASAADTQTASAPGPENESDSPAAAENPSAAATVAEQADVGAQRASEASGPETDPSATQLVSGAGTPQHEPASVAPDPGAGSPPAPQSETEAASPFAPQSETHAGSPSAPESEPEAGSPRAPQPERGTGSPPAQQSEPGAGSRRAPQPEPEAGSPPAPQSEPEAAVESADPERAPNAEPAAARTPNTIPAEDAVPAPAPASGPASNTATETKSGVTPAPVPISPTTLLPAPLLR